MRHAPGAVSLTEPRGTETGQSVAAAGFGSVAAFASEPVALDALEPAEEPEAPPPSAPLTVDDAEVGLDPAIAFELPLFESVL